MRIDLTDILSREEGTLDMEIPVEMQDYELQDTSYPVERAEPLHLLVEHQGKQMLHIEAAGEVTLRIPCARCLTPVNVRFPIQVDTEISQKDLDAETEADEHNYLSDRLLDSEQLIRDEILVGWPIRVLCREDCRGICSQCGCNLNERDCGCERNSPDPRMAAIATIFKNAKEV